MPLIELKSYRAVCDTCKTAKYFFGRTPTEAKYPEEWSAVPLYGPSGLEGYRLTCNVCQEEQEGKSNGRT